ncbi:MAG: hypothetical protein WD652_05035 [Acidimicrobiia bacterium]
MSSDPALALTVAYLRLNGYFLITEQDLHIREPSGYRSLTDIDIIALRPPAAPGPAHHRAGAQVEECLIITDVDPALDADPIRFDVIIAEVKTDEAAVNRALRTPGALHAALRRTGDVYATPLDVVVDQLVAHGESLTSTARSRLVAFAGHGKIAKGTTVHLSDAARFIRGHLRTHHDLYRVSRFADPVVALLALLDKVE